VEELGGGMCRGRGYNMSKKKFVKRLLLLVCVICLTSGCASYAPPNNSPFTYIKELKDLDGIYFNLGEGELTRKLYLSSLIWKNDKQLNHKAITSIQVKANDAEILSVKAIADGNIKKESLFRLNKDFILSSGKIPFKDVWGIPVPILGIGYKSSEIGIDQSRNGKYKENVTVGGLFAVLIPIFMTGSEEFRFTRVKPKNSSTTNPDK
jgi:hypothetical protein